MNAFFFFFDVLNCFGSFQWRVTRNEGDVCLNQTNNSVQPRCVQSLLNSQDAAEQSLLCRTAKRCIFLWWKIYEYYFKHKFRNVKIQINMFSTTVSEFNVLIPGMMQKQDDV